MLERQDWVDIRFLGERDYYNSKPPLNVWLIAASFATLGQTLFALRLPSATAAWVTVALLIVWGRRHLGNTVAVVAGLVLATSFGFLYVHSGRTANTDALFTLMLTLTALVLMESRERPGRLRWCGPILASVFLLRGMAVLMPALMIVGVGLARRELVTRARAYGTVAVIALLPILAWGIARWLVDGPLFFVALIRNDLIGVTTEILDNHAGGWLFYPAVLLKYHYDWALAALATFALARRYGHPCADVRLVLLVWGLVTVGVPTLMATKTSWYLTSFYPCFAILAALAIAPALSVEWHQARGKAAVAVIVLAVLTAEGRLVWRSVMHRDLSRSIQGALLSNAPAIQGHRVHKRKWDHADRFVVERMAGGRVITSDTLEEAIAASVADDFVVWHDEVDHPSLALAGRSRRQFLYRRTD